MGIQNYQQFVKKTYPSACQKVHATFDNLYIDINHVLHHVCYLAKNTEDLTARFKDYLLSIIKFNTPRKRVFFDADGPAPMAKMMLQRTRRLDTVKTEETIDLTKNLSLNLTPGTSFMLKLEQELENFIAYIKIKYKIDVFSSITEDGEGELKIRYHVQKTQKKYPDETHLVISGDSDMILLLFTCDDLDKIYQMVNKDMFIHFGTLLKEHRKIFGKTDSDKYDFVFINLLMGNDYIPKVSFLKLESLWEAYKLVAGSRSTGLIKFDKSSFTVDSIFIHDLLYIATKSTPKHLMNRFKITEISSPHYKNYVDGLFWCFSMYSSGVCSDYRYLYNNNISPHVTGVMLSIMFNNVFSVIKTDSIDVDLYGILLIPEKASALLTKEQNLIVKKLVKKHPVIYEEERCSKCRRYYVQLSKLNKEAKLYDSDSPDRTDTVKQITKLNKELLLHKTSHENIVTKIDEIIKDFLTVRDELRETISLESDYSSSKHEDVPYKPRIRVKKLF